jgi:hypothetical protein
MVGSLIERIGVLRVECEKEISEAMRVIATSKESFNVSK